MNLFFDLDGTIIDSRERLYVLFQQLVEESSLTIDEYWNLKRNKIGHRKILKENFDYSDKQFVDFENIWMENIESPEMLALDKPFKNIDYFLNKLKSNHNLYLVTSRQFKKGALSQLENLNLSQYFKEILVTEQKNEKAFLIKNCCKITQNDCIIGDTGKDIQTGKILNIKTIAVTCGFLSHECLLSYNPDIIVNKVTEINFDGIDKAMKQEQGVQNGD